MTKIMYKSPWAFALLFICIDALNADTSTRASADEANIRSNRLAFNLAIRDQDIEAIGNFFAPEYHIITGRSVQSHGKAAERGLWAETFAEDPGFICQRVIRELRINSDWGLAEELGNWTCDYSAANQLIHATGVYAAKWQRSASEHWLIQSEVFTTMTCKGIDAGCRPPDPIGETD
jgi:ketosteroid isomerase-like protein